MLETAPSNGQEIPLRLAPQSSCRLTLTIVVVQHNGDQPFFHLTDESRPKRAHLDRGDSGSRIEGMR